ncbi:unnamed protein product [Urochloa humidicola]
MEGHGGPGGSRLGGLVVVCVELVGLGVEPPDEEDAGDGGGEEDEDDPQRAHLFVLLWVWIPLQGRGSNEATNPLAEGIGLDSRKAAAFALLLVAGLWGWGEKQSNGGLGVGAADPPSPSPRRDGFLLTRSDKEAGASTRSPNACLALIIDELDRKRKNEMAREQRRAQINLGRKTRERERERGRFAARKKNLRRGGREGKATEKRGERSPPHLFPPR